MSEATAKPMVELTIDGKKATVPDGTNVLEAAKSVGIRVPNFCYHADLTWEGSCRMCLVSIEGRPKLAPSCCEPVKAGMVVHVGSPEAETARRAQLEFILLNHPLDCPICDQAGECKLQDYYVEHGRYESRMPRGLKVHKKKVVDLGERIVLDKERCVLCSRCVRFCREVSGSHALQFFTRGVTTEIGTENDGPITGDDYIGNVVDICPVGALTAKDFRFRQRVWFLKSAESVCGHCSTGCNIRVDSKDGTVYRFVPRRNPEVNKSWICDAGRDSYKLLQGPGRLAGPRLRRAGTHVPASWEEALDAAQAAIAHGKKAGANGIAAIASPDVSTEALYVFRAFARDVLGTSLVDYRVDGSHEKTTVMADKILRHADPHANNTACAWLGLGQASVNDILDACEKEQVKTLYVLRAEFLRGHPEPERVRRALSRVEHVIAHATHDIPELTLASVVFPDATYLEMDGTFVNYQGRVQRFARAYPPVAEAWPATGVMAQLAKRLGGAVPAGTADKLFDEMSAAEPAFGGLRWKDLGLLGAQPKSAQTVGAEER
ncbi:MAG TPA: molybdopterin-dependent oxidoreductase [Candidatus Eisenbacteria bacterium]|nr:molybdopterin-dependent oxidoreductase [Candidatus Eisenbacteria bacterium]